VTEYRYIPPGEAGAYRDVGWTVQPLRGYHGLFSMLAWRELVPEL
jgi:hypothetical protein